MLKLNSHLVVSSIVACCFLAIQGNLAQGQQGNSQQEGLSGQIGPFEERSRTSGSSISQCIEGCSFPNTYRQARRCFEREEVAIVEYEIDENGRVINPRITSSSGNYSYDEAILRDLENMNFEPGQRHKRKVRINIVEYGSQRHHEAELRQIERQGQKQNQQSQSLPKVDTNTEPTLSPSISYNCQEQSQPQLQ